MDGARTVTVVVVVAEPLPQGAASARVLVEDVSRVDAPAVTVAEAARPLTAPLRAGDGFTTELVVHEVDERASYNVRAHLDVSGTGGVSSGDRVTTRSYPVLTRGAPDRVEVEAVQI